MSAKKVKVLVVRERIPERIEVWANTDLEILENIQGVYGVSHVNTERFAVFIDPRYNTNDVIATIETKLTS